MESQYISLLIPYGLLYVYIENLLKKLDIAFEEILEKEESPNVFVAMRGEAKTEDEKIAVDKMISMMLCLKMHHVLRGKLYA